MDQNYANAYIKTATATLHDHVNLLLSVKSENIVLNEIIQNQNSQIQNLNGKIEALIAELSNRTSEEEALSLRNKASSLDTAINQLNEMKAVIRSKDDEINSMRSKLAEKEKEIEVLKTEKQSSAILVPTPKRKRGTIIQDIGQNNF